MMRTGLYRTLVLIIVGSLTTGGCYTTREVPPTVLAPLTRGEHAREIIVPSVDGRNVRVGPSSEIRFKRLDGQLTPWVRGSQILVSPEGVFARTPAGAPELQVRWGEVAGAEVKNLSGGKTVVVVLAVAILIGVVLVLALGGGKGGGGGGGLRGVRLGGSHHGHGGRGLLHGGRGLGHRVGHGIDLGVRIVDPVPVGPDGAAIPPPPPPPPPAVPVPLFSAGLQRRARLLFHASLWAGGDLFDRVSGGGGAHVGLRLGHVFELGLGAKLLGHRTEREQAAGYGTRSEWMALVRLGLHFDLDAARRVAIPLGVDLGIGHAMPYVRTYVGLRLRLFEGLYLGLYPISPTYADLSASEKRGTNGWWTFPSEIELGFTF